MFPQWLLPTAAAVASVLSAIVVWGFATGRWVQGRETDHSEIEKMRRELQKVRDLEHTETAKLRRELEKFEEERRRWAERVNVDLGKLQGQVTSEEKLLELRFQHLDVQVQAIRVDVEEVRELLQERLQELRKHRDWLIEIQGHLDLRRRDRS